VPFTFWDYRQLAFPKNTRHAHRPRLRHAVDRQPRSPTPTVDREARKTGKSASDHAPVVVDLAD
jgi:exonuclease III